MAEYSQMKVIKGISDQINIFIKYKHNASLLLDKAEKYYTTNSRAKSRKILHNK